jgi:hypothetical protein
VVWLDSHWTTGLPESEKLTPPILTELSVIFSQHHHAHVVLIDDARLFVGREGYPTGSEVERLIHRLAPEYVVEIKEDVIQCYPAH